MAEITAREKADKICRACEEALEKFEKLKKQEYEDIISKLKYVLASYKHDGNPVGLYGMGRKSFDLLSAHKKEKPRQVSKKLLETLDKALKLAESSLEKN